MNSTNKQILKNEFNQLIEDKVNMKEKAKFITDQIIVPFLEKNSTFNNLNINGCWGSGKTTLISYIINYIEENLNNFNIKHLTYNLWEYSIYNNPLLMLMDNILEDIGGKNAVGTFKKILKKAGIFALDMLSIKLTGKDISNYLENNSNNDYQKHDNLFKKIVENIEKVSKDQKIIIFFDELDRCTSSEMIYLLNIIKNIFLKVKNIFFMIACNSDYIDSTLNLPIKHNEEHYTNKIFSQKINMKYLINFDRHKFTSNEYIKQFIFQIKEPNLRIYNNVIRTTEKFINSKENYSKYFEAENINLCLEKYEFFAFFLYFLKFTNSDMYENIIKFILSPESVEERLQQKFKVLDTYILKNNQTPFLNSLLNKNESLIWNPPINLFFNINREEIKYQSTYSNLINFMLLLTWDKLKEINVNDFIMKEATDKYGKKCYFIEIYDDYFSNSLEEYFEFKYFFKVWFNWNEHCKKKSFSEIYFEEIIKKSIIDFL